MLSPKAVFVASMMIAMLMAPGCGKVGLAGADPYASSPGSYAGPGVSGTPVVVAPTPAPQPVYNPPLPMGRLEAKVTKCDCGFLKLGLFTKTAYVEVKNPTTVPLKGKVKLQFTDDGSPLADIAVDPKDVELGPGETQNLTFTGKGMKIDGAAVQVQMDGESVPGVPATPAGGSSGSGSTASSVYGTPPGLR